MIFEHFPPTYKRFIKTQIKLFQAGPWPTIDFLISLQNQQKNL